MVVLRLVLHRINLYAYQLTYRLMEEAVIMGAACQYLQDVTTKIWI